MLCAVHQPNFFPRLSTLAKIFASDRLVLLEDVQFVRRDYQHRCRLAAMADSARQQWLSLSVQLPHGRKTAIDQVRIVEHERCRRRVFGLLQQYYARSAHWDRAQASVRAVLDLLTVSDSLAEVAEASTIGLLDLVGWKGRVLHSSTMPARAERSERLADLTRAAGCTGYLYGTGGARYLDTEPFSRLGLTAHLIEPPPLSKQVPRVSALWAMMTLGPSAVRDQLGSWNGMVPRATGYGDRLPTTVT